MTRTINTWRVPATFIATGAITGLMLLAAPAAHAVPPGQLESQCRGLGGEWTVHYGDEVMYSCCYKPLAGAGQTTCDYYASDGTFMGSLDSDTKPTLPPAAPGQFRPTVPPSQTTH